MNNISSSPQQTQQIATNFAKNLTGGAIIALYGNLGNGKTTFVQGLAKGLGIEKRIISPTFVVVRTYKINDEQKKARNFYHIDLYRIQAHHDLENLGLREIFVDKEAIVAIEWPDKLGTLLPEKRIDVQFEYIDDTTRKVIIHEKK